VNARFDKKRWTALQTAADFQSPPLIALLLQHGALVDAQDSDGYSALHWAATSGSAKCVQLLLDAGADKTLLTAKRKGSKTPLLCAWQAGHRLIVMKLNTENDPRFVIPIEPEVSVEPATELAKRARPSYADWESESDERRGAKHGGSRLAIRTIKPKREPNLSGVAWSASADEGKGKWLAFSVETEQQLPGGLAHNAEKDGENLNFAAPLLVIGHFDSRAEAAEALAYSLQLLGQQGQTVEQMVSGPDPLMPPLPPRGMGRAKKGRGEGTEVVVRTKAAAWIADPGCVSWWVGDSHAGMEGSQGGRASQHEAGNEEEERCEDDELGCGICNEDSWTKKNPIIVCDGCSLGAHVMCYGVPKVPEGKWFCAPCTDARAESRPRDAQIARTARECRLCPLPGGALWRVAEGAEGGYVHGVCCLAAGYFAKPFNGSVQSLDKIKALAHARTETAVCALCGDPYGAVVRCYHRDPQPPNKRCAIAMHVSCAHLRNLGTCVSAKSVYSVGGIDAEKTNRAGGSKEMIRHICPEHFNPAEGANLALALEAAVRARDRARVAELLTQGAHPDTFVGRWDKRGRGGGGKAGGGEDAGLCFPTALHAAAARNDPVSLEMSLALLERVDKGLQHDDDSDDAEHLSVVAQHVAEVHKEGVHSALDAAAASNAAEALLVLLLRLEPPP